MDNNEKAQLTKLLSQLPGVLDELHREPPWEGDQAERVAAEFATPADAAMSLAAALDTLRRIA